MKKQKGEIEKLKEVGGASPEKEGKPLRVGDIKRGCFFGNRRTLRLKRGSLAKRGFRQNKKGEVIFHAHLNLRAIGNSTSVLTTR